MDNEEKVFTEQELTKVVCKLLTSNQEWVDFDKFDKKPDQVYYAKQDNGRIIITTYKTTSHVSGWAELTLSIDEEGQPCYRWDGHTFTFGLKKSQLKIFPFIND